jgi:transcriptional regulator with XRE-family HTH domain
MSLREIGRQAGIDVAQLSRFARGERQLTTGDGLDRLVNFLGLAVTKKGRKR